MVLPSSPNPVPDTIPPWSANVSNAVNNDISIVGICMFASNCLIPRVLLNSSGDFPQVKR